jgi:hypothetical protein
LGCTQPVNDSNPKIIMATSQLENRSDPLFVLFLMFL